MTDLKPSPSKLRRGIPFSPLFIEVTSTGIEIRVRGSRKPGVFFPFLKMLQDAPVPEYAPAKCANGLDYLNHIRRQQERAEERACNKDSD
jgi:hypothetical protein